MDEQSKYQWVAAQILPHEAEVRGWLRRHVRSLSGADVDDLLQESYVRLWGADFNHIANGRSYFFTVVRNLLLEQARRARIVPMVRMSEIEALRLVSEEPEPERRVAARQELQRLREIIAELPKQCRCAFELQKLHELPHKEVARRMGVTCKTVEKHLTKALAKIIDAMGRTGSHQQGRRERPRRKDHGARE